MDFFDKKILMGNPIFVMPLKKGKSKKDFSYNVEELMNSGHEQKQALAIAYSMMRKRKPKK